MSAVSDLNAQADAILAADDEKIIAVSDLDQKFVKDLSYFPDQAKLEKVWDEYVASMSPVVSAARDLGVASVRAARLEWDLRSLTFTADDVPDFAGQTRAWKALYEDRFEKAYKAAGLTPTQWKVFRRNVTQASYDHGLKAEYMSRYAVANVATLKTATITTKVKKSEENPTGKIVTPVADIVAENRAGADIPSDVVKEIRRISALQKTPSGDKIANGFQPDQIPLVFGKPSRDPKGNGTGQKANAKTIEAHWTAVFADMEKIRDGSVSLTSQANNVHKLATQIVDILNGGPENTPKSMPKAKIKNSTEVQGILAEAGKVLTVGTDLWKAAGTDAAPKIRETLNGHRYTEEA